VRDVVLAKRPASTSLSSSDHYFPWLDSQGHAPRVERAWRRCQATEHIPLMTYVTCPIRRYHPAVVAQKAATMQLLSDGRSPSDSGAGENLNEHGCRRAMARRPVSATRCSKRLWRSFGPCGQAVGEHTGAHFDVERQRSGTCRRVRHPSASRCRGAKAVVWRVGMPDAMIAVEPRAELGQMFDQAGGSKKPRVGQIALSYDPDRQIASEAGYGPVPLVHGRLESKR